jgi:tripartite-type tricarboxylate transporter receptor subunit TctC
MTNMPHRWLCILALLSMGLVAPASAETWPSKPIKVIVPYSPGSATDIIPRTVFAKVQEQIGQSIVVENRPGGATAIGTSSVAKAEPDGYTLLVHSSAYTIVPLTFSSLSYDPQRDLTGVIPLGNMANVLVINPDKGIKTIAEFVKAARASGTSMSYVTIGSGSAAHLNSERFRLSAGFPAQPIFYKGSPEGLMDVMSGRVDFYFSPLLPALPQIKAGKLVALAVSSTQRSPDLPGVPTTIEAGYKNSEYNFWFGVFAPAKTPREIVERLNREVAKALEDPGVKGKLTKLGVQPMPKTPKQFDDYVSMELKQNAELVKAAGIKVQ